MENNEVMVAEDVIETAVEVVKAKPKAAVTIAIATGGLAILGIVVYKKVIKPRRDKKKAEKEAMIDTDFDECDETEFDSEE